MKLNKMLLSIMLHSLHIATILTVYEATELSIKDLSNYLDDSIAQFRLSVHKKLQQNKRRLKRGLQVNDFLQLEKNNTFEIQLKNITPIQSVPTIYPLELAPFTIDGVNYLTVVSFKSNNEQYTSLSSIYKINQSDESKFDLLQNFSTSGGVDFEFADFGNEKYAIFLDSIGVQTWFGGSIYEKSFSIYQYMPQEDFKKPFQYKSKVRALGAKSVKVFMRQGIPFFVTANSYMDNGFQYQVKSTMHAKTSKGFELIQEFDTMAAQDVEVVVINDERFILFVNHQDNSGNVDIYSSIYKERSAQEYNGVDGPFALYQRILTHGGRDFEYFSFEGNSYLAVANEYTKIASDDAATEGSKFTTVYDIDSVIYWWTGKIWVEWQRIPTQGAVKWTYFQADSGEPMLVVANSKSQAVIYTYDPLRGIFKPTQLQGLNPFQGNSTYIPDVRSVMSFKMKNSTYLAVANYEKNAQSGYNIFKLEFQRTAVQSLKSTIPEIISKLLEKMELEMEEIKASLSSVLLDVVGQIMTKSGDQNITSKVYLEQVIVTDTITASEVLYRKNISNNPVELIEKEALRLKTLLQEQKTKIMLLEKRFNDAVLISQDAKVTGTKTFGKIKLTNLASNTTLVKGYVDGVNISDLKENSFSKSADQNITGCFTFNSFSVTGNLTLNGKLNDVPIDHFLTTNSEQTITGAKTFYDQLIVVSNVNLSNFKFNGLVIPDDLFKKSGNQTITGYKSFNNLEFNKPVYINDLIDGLNITDFNSKKVTVHSAQNITQNVRFQNGFTVNSDLLIKGLVDNASLDNLKENIDVSMGDQIIQSSNIFKKVVVKKSIHVEDINGYNMSEVFTTNTQQTITANLTFKQDVNVKGDIIAGTIDEIKLSTEAVTRGEDQIITGTKTFFSPTIEANTSVTGLVNGVNISYWGKNSVLKNSSVQISGKKIFTNGAKVKKQLYAHKINNITTELQKADFVLVNDDGNWTSQFIFENVSVLGNTRVNGYVNGFRVLDDFVLLTSNQTILGNKEFAFNVTIGGDFKSLSNLNNENFTHFFDDAVKNNTDEIVTAPLYFQNNIYFKNNVTFSKLNNLSIPDDIVTLNTYQNVTGHLSFSEPSVFFGKVLTRIVIVNKTVNGIDLSEMEKDAIYKDRNQTVNGSLVFLGGISCFQNLSVAGFINGVNLEDLVNNSVRISKAQEIKGSVIFESDVLFKSPITTPGTINGFDLRKLNNTVFKKAGNQVILKEVLAQNNLTIENITLSDNSTINGVNLRDFLEKAVKSTASVHLNGSLIFENDLIVKNLYADHLNSVNTSNILLTSTNQTVYRQFFLSAQAEDIRVNGLIDNINLTEIDKFLLRLDGDQNISATYNFGSGFSVQNNITVNGNINGLDLKAFFDSSVHLSSYEAIFGLMKFEKVSFGDVSFNAHLNRVNVSELVLDGLTVTGPQEICHHKKFSSKINTANLSATNIITENLVNGVNVTELNEASVKLDKEQVLTGNYHFNGDLLLAKLLMSGKLNNINLTKDMLTTFGEQSVYGYKVFNNFTTSGNLNLSGFVDGINVNSLEANRVTLNGNQQVFGDKAFLTVTAKKDILFPKNATINNIDASVDLILKNEKGTISGNKFFTDVYVAGDLNTASGVVNGVNITEMEKQTFMVNSEDIQLISDDQVFFETLTISGDLVVNGTINGMFVNRPKIYNKDLSTFLESELQNLIGATNATCQSTSYLMQVSNSGSFLNGLEIQYTISLTNAMIGEIDSLVSGNNVFISIARAPGSGCGAAYILRCSYNMQCEVIQTIYTNAKSIEFFEHNSLFAVYIANEDMGLKLIEECKNEPEIFIWSVSSSKFVPSQSLNSSNTELNDILNVRNNVSLYLTQTYGQYDQISNTYLSPNSITWNFSDLTNIVVSWEKNGVDYVDILSLNETQSFKKKQRIRVGKGKILGFGQLKNGKTVLSVSSDTINENSIYIQNNATGYFEFYQKLSHTATSVKIENINQKSYIWYASSLEGLGLCEWQGISGFGNCRSIETTGASYVEVIFTTDGVFIIAGGENELMIYKAVMEGNTLEYQKPIC